MSMNTKKILLVLCVLLFSGSHVFAGGDPIVALQQEMTSLRQMVSELKGVVEKQSRIISNQGSKIMGLSEQLEREVRVATPKAQPSSYMGSKVPKWTPEIGVIADMVAKLDSAKEDAEGADRLSVREVELVFGSEIDPYSRFDATISFSDFEQASLEEMYVTHFGLPWEITGRFGKFKPKVGKAIPVHRDSLDTVDEPLVIEKWFGVEGYSKAGADFTKALEFPWPLPQEITIGVLEGGNGEEGTAFGDVRRRQTFYSHAENYIDISDVTGLELGLSHLAGSKDADSSKEINIIGFDGTLTHHISSTSRVKLQSEVFYMDRQETDTDLEDNLWGLYALVDVQMNPKWALGFRYDHVDPVDNPVVNPDDSDEAYSGYITFFQSEFARWRAQFKHVDAASGVDDNQFLLQGTFSIGEHKHKIN